MPEFPKHRMNSAHAALVACALFLAAVMASSDARADTASASGAPDGSTPLQWAVYRNDPNEVKQLLTAGADVAARNAYGVTALELAAETGNPAILRLLLDAGADVESPN